MTEKKGDFKLIGLKLKGKTTNQNNQSGKNCGDLWQKFETDKIFDLLSHFHPPPNERYSSTIASNN